MKKIFIVSLLLLVLFGCTSKKDPDNIQVNPPTNEVFACGPNENCVTRTSTKDVLDRNMMVISFDDSLNHLDETVALFYSFDNCPWCYDAIQVLNGIYRNYNMPTYYVEVSRDERVDGNKTYEHLKEKFSSQIEEKMYIPFFVVLKDGEVVGSNTGTVEDHVKEGDVLPIMTDEQKYKLSDIYNSLYQKAS